MYNKEIGDNKLSVTTAQEVSKQPPLFFDNEIRFRLHKKFVKQYKNKKPPFGFNALGELVFFRTYSRSKEDNSNEQFYETLERVVNGLYSIQKRHILKYNLVWSESKAQKSAQEMYDRLFHMKFIGSGRGFWALGTPIIEEKQLGQSLSNCCFKTTANIDKNFSEPFTFMMDFSMCGVGVGFDVRGAGKVKILGPDNSATIQEVIIEDSREGWCESLKYLLDSYAYNTSPVEFDYSFIRPKGSPIRTFGGIAPGPEPLMDLHKDIRKILNNRIGSHITIRDISDIMNLIGKCVVSGNVRRCLPKDTLIHTDKGLIKIQDIKPGMKAATSKGYYNISELLHQGKQQLIKITTQLGEFKCTPNHKIAVISGIEQYTWKKAKNLTDTDQLVLPISILDGLDTQLPPWEYIKPKNSTTCYNIYIPKLDTDIAWFLGYLHGDGYVCTNRHKNGFNAHVSIAVNAAETKIKEQVIQQLKRFAPNHKIHIVNPSKKDKSYKIRIASKQLAYYLSQFKEPKKTIEIPECILRGNVRIRSAYLAGIFDADGYQAKNRNGGLRVVDSVYQNYVKQLQAVYASLGIPSRMYKKIRSETESRWQNIHFLKVIGAKSFTNFNQFVAPHIKRLRFYKPNSKNYKCNNDYVYPLDYITNQNISYVGRWDAKLKQATVASLEKVTNKYYKLIPVKVTKVELTSEIADTYDISVPKVNEFICQEGLLVHNSSQLNLGDPYSLEFLDLKNYEVNPERAAFGWASNNSIMAEIGMDYSNVGERTRINGEPGYIWLDNCRKFSRFVDHPDDKDMKVMGLNPCLRASAPILTRKGIITLSELKVGDEIWSAEGWTKVLRKWSTGIKKVYKYTTIAGYFEGTENHRVMCEGKKVEVGQASHIDIVQGPEPTDNDLNHISKQDIMDGLVLCDDQYYNTNEHHDTIVINKTKHSIPQSVIKGTVSKKLGFLMGLYTSNGYIDGSRIVLKSTSLRLIEQVQIVLSSIGIRSYRTNENYLNISIDRELFQKYIGFIHVDKNRRLQGMVARVGGGRGQEAYPIRNVEYLGEEEVFDITVNNRTHTFWCQGLNISNCSEIALEDSETCNLCTVVPDNHDNMEDFLTTLKYAYLYAKTVSLVQTSDPITNTVIWKNRRIGCSLTGLAQFITHRGLDELRKWCEQGYTTLKYYDRQYSDWFGVPRSIKITTLKPEGSLTLLAGATSGLHYPESRFYIRRIRLANNSPLIAPLQDAGYHIEVDVANPKSTVVAEIPVDVGEGIRTAGELSMWEQLSLAAFMQKHWADNAVSITVTFDPETEGHQIESALNFFQYQLKAVSFLPRMKGTTAYPQMPYEAISEEEYNKKMETIKTISFNYKNGEDGVGEKFCNGDKCQI